MRPQYRRLLTPRSSVLARVVAQNTLLEPASTDHGLGVPGGYGFYKGRNIDTPVAPYNILFDGGPASFVFGATLTGPSGTARIINIPDTAAVSGTLTLDTIVGTFTDNQAITSGAQAAVVNGSLIPFTSQTGWGHVYPLVGRPYSTAGTIEIRDYHSLVRNKTTFVWTEIQPPSSTIGGAYYHQDLVGSTQAATFTTLGSGHFSVPKPPTNEAWMAHFWMDPRGTYDGNVSDYSYTQCEVRIRGGGGPMAIQIGHDWWLTPSAVFVDGFDNNPGTGSSNWINLTEDWQTCGLYSCTTAQFLSSVPALLK